MVRDGHLIALDWGTTHVRAALLDQRGNALDVTTGESGVGTLDRDGFGQRFAALTEGWPQVPAIAAGMVGSRQGWHEAPYLTCPTGFEGLNAGLVCFQHGGRDIAIVPGLKMMQDTRRDVMRGEETQIAGFLTTRPSFSGTLVLPGTHSKWVYIQNGVVEHFTSYMTGDMFQALAHHTMLRPAVTESALESMAGDGPYTEGDTAFQDAIRDVITGEGSDLRRLFDLRARTLLDGLAPGAARERLSGLLIGMEIMAAAQDRYDVEAFHIIGSGALVRRYERAAAVLGAVVGVDVHCHDGSALIWPALHTIAQQAALV
ncbi:MAG: 2-dehydro-3-deoxygalactonokinase [Pseudomonadota bacterium]